ncbi:hypothetical protein FOCG_18296 [Fusarium oxysporum f. sp. radicis-lycopersici 26381]|nr:hypothetical protein FOCG_18296 [Fusarium oxysporum f. sp. radicis-lycopersici 26381]
MWSIVINVVTNSEKPGLKKSTGIADPPPSASSDTETAGRPFVVIDSASAPTRVFQTSISITGMSCSSCVGKIIAALEQKPWVRSANVALLTQSATVGLDGEQNAEELVRIINDLGYEANLEHVDELPPAQTCGRPPTPSEALESFPWTESVDVSLIINSATVVFKDRRHLNKIVEAIENVGYKAKLSDVIDFSKDTAQDGCRTASIRIDGMYCQHCPGRVTEALVRFGERMSIEKSATLGNPIMTVSYTPQLPRLHH